MTSSLGQVARCPLPDDQAKLLLASSGKGSSGSTSVDVHPVVLMHIADHHQRNVAQQGGKDQSKRLYEFCKSSHHKSMLWFVAVFGALLGRQEGPKAEICFAFEIIVTKEANRFVLNKEYWLLKEEQCEWLVCIFWNWNLTVMFCSQANSSWIGLCWLVYGFRWVPIFGWSSFTEPGELCWFA